jgi:hypothetical protein
MRFVLSSVQFGFTRKAPTVATPAAAKADIDVSLVSVSEETAEVILAIPAHDLATHAHLLEVRAYLVPFAEADQAFDAEALVTGTHPFGRADVSGLQTGGDVTIRLPDVPEGVHAGRVVLGFNDAG